jgi:hypothetical protein
MEGGPRGMPKGSQRMDLESKRRFPTAILIAATVLVAAAVVAYLALGRGAGHRADLHLPFGPSEQAYASHIRLENLKMSRASNYLRQEVTFLSGSVTNDGPRTVRDVEVTVEYYDSLNRVILRERMSLFGARPIPLGPGEKRPFQLGFEHIPPTWNYVYPTIRISGLRFE